MRVKPVILCGGSGTRLWPLSTVERPKQFQALTGPESMISLTRSRLVSDQRLDVEIDRTLVVGSQKHEHLLKQQLPDATFILEPFGRNSAPAVAAACLAVEPFEMLLVLPADHDIQKPNEFLKAISIGQNEANSGAIVTFGIKPTHPATGYGYINAQGAASSVRTVEKFVEKPPLKTAERYIEDGNFYWNAGIFLFKASVMIEAFERNAPDVLQKIRSLVSDRGDTEWYLEPTVFGQVEDISVDYAIMEREKNIKVVPVDMGWNDVGGYDALWEMFATGDARTATFGPTIVEKSRDIFVRSEGPLVCVSGVSDLAVVAKRDVVMIVPKSDFSAVKRLGIAAQSNPHSQSISDETATLAKNLMWKAFDYWKSHAWDEENTGFVESLEMSGVPKFSANRRVRVQARQVFSFSQALLIGYADRGAAEKLVDLGLDYIQRICRHEDGGFVHKIDPSGSVVDDKRDLYDHAFIILGGAAAYRATNDSKGLDLALDALTFVDENLVDSQYGGFHEDSLGLNTPRRANPHMHLLEAFMELYRATGNQQFLSRATEIVELFESKFFDPKSNILREFFEKDWAPAEGEKGRLFEPGHHYEWATLLFYYSSLCGRDTISWRRRLIQKADSFGSNPRNNFSMNVVLPNGDAIDQNSRIWHQLERFRARLHHPETSYPGESDKFFGKLHRSFFSPVRDGTWIDELSSDGEIKSTAIPASILYHMVTAFLPAIRESNEGSS